MLYIKEVDRVLRRHLTTLRSMYARYAEGFKDHADVAGQGLNARHLLSAGEWLACLHHLGLLDSGQVNQVEAKQIFLWSRIRSCDDYSEASERNLCNLFFEDFLEAIVRVACVMALPTDEEIKEAGAEDGGQFLLWYEAAAPREFENFVLQRKQPWHREPRQKVWRCLDHFLTYIARLVETNTSREATRGHGDADMIVSAQEAAQFAELRHKGVVLQRMPTADKDETERDRRGNAFRMALLNVSARLLASLQRVELFSTMGSVELERLRDCMVEAPFQGLRALVPSNTRRALAVWRMCLGQTDKLTDPCYRNPMATLCESLGRLSLIGSYLSPHRVCRG